jgi:hypothetical protein
MSDVPSMDSDSHEHEGAETAAPAAAQLSIEIPDQEVIVRALKTPVHYDFKKSRLKPSAYRPRPGERIISVARAIVGVDECKKNIKVFDKRNEYIGFGAIYAGAIRACGSQVLDEPADYYGHAHVEHPVDAPIQDEPNSAEMNEAYIPLLRSLASKTEPYIDPTKDEETWGGPPVLSPPPF